MVRSAGDCVAGRGIGLAVAITAALAAPATPSPIKGEGFSLRRIDHAIQPRGRGAALRINSRAYPGLFRAGIRAGALAVTLALMLAGTKL